MRRRSAESGFTRRGEAVHRTVADAVCDEDIADGLEAELAVNPHQMLLSVEQEIVEACTPSVVDRCPDHAPPVREAPIFREHSEPLEFCHGFLAISDGSPSRHGHWNVLRITDQMQDAIIDKFPILI